MAIKITVFIIVPSPESCLAYLLPTQIYKEKVFFCAGETLTPKPELISIRALMLFTGDRQNTIHQSLLRSLSLLSVTVFTFLSLDCPSLTSTFFFFFFFTSCQSISPEGTPAFLPSFPPSCFLLYLPSLPPSSQIPLYLPETLSVSSWLIFSRLIWLEHAKLINMVWSGLTYHRTICTYITHTCSHAPPTSTHSHIHTRNVDETLRGEWGVMGTTSERKWGRRADIKRKRKR